MAKGDFTAKIDPRDYVKIMDTLSGLSEIEREAAIAKAISEGLDVILRQGKANLAASNIKTRTGNLKGSFTKLTNKTKLYGYAGFKRPQGAAAHLLDRGTKKRYTKTGANRGSVTGNYFWTKAVEMKKEEAQRELMDSVEKTIQNIINRNN